MPIQSNLHRNRTSESYLEGRDINFRRGSNDICLVHSSQGDTVDLEGTGDQKQTASKGLQEYNALSTVSASEEDKDGSGGDGAAH